MSIKLNSEQENAVSALTKFSSSKDKSFISVIGGAGTGKTTTITHWLKSVENTGLKVCFTAPTNKAVRVLKKMAAQNKLNVSCVTIHKLLGLKLVIEKDKEVIKKSNSKNTITDYDCVVIDEMSMVSTELLDYLNKAIKFSDTLVIFMGDDCQLPPIGEPLSPTFSIENKIVLNKVMRQRDENPILGLCTDIRNSIKTGLLTIPELVPATNKDGTIGVHVMSGELFSKWMPSAFKNEEFDSNCDKFRTIAWRNKTVDSYNKHIQHIRYARINTPFAVGEPIIFSSPLHRISTFADYSIDKRVVSGWDDVLITTETECVVTDIKEIEPFYYEKFPVNRYLVSCNVLDGEEPKISFVVTNKSNLQDLLNHISNLIHDGKATWFNFWLIKKYFADVRPAYSMTAHKCLPLNSKITTDAQIKSISELVIGDSVISGSGNIQNVLDVVKTGKKEEFFIKTKSGREFISSADHRYLMPDGNYKKAKDINTNDFLSLWRSQDEHCFSFDLNYWGYGYLVGDGCYSYKSNRVDITVIKDSNVVDLLKEFLGKHGSIVYEYNKKENKAISLSTESKLFRDELLSVGINRVTKTEKSICTLMTKNQKANFIRGLMDSDGSCCHDRSCIRLVNISESLIDDVLILLQDFGIIGRKKHKKSSNKNHSDVFTLSIFGSDCIKYLNQIGFSVDYKMNRLVNVCKKIKGKSSIDFIPESLGIKDIINKTIKDNIARGKKGYGFYANKDTSLTKILVGKNLSYFHLQLIAEHLINRKIDLPYQIKSLLDSFYFYDEVIEVGYTGNSVEMMDIEVSNDHNFICNGAVVHNSQGSTFENVFVDVRDILTNPNREEALRCLYVAISRASHNVILNV